MERSKTLEELVDNSEPFIVDNPHLDDRAEKLPSSEARQRLMRLREALAAIEAWRADALEARLRAFAEDEGVKLREVAQPLRAALTGRAVSPPVFEVMVALGPQACLSRIEAIAEYAATSMG